LSYHMEYKIRYSIVAAVSLFLASYAVYERFVIGTRMAQSSSTNVSSGLMLSPSVRDFGTVLPGSCHGSFVLTNTSSQRISDLSVATSCFCVTPGTRHISVINPGKSVTIPFTMTTPIVEEAHQRIEVTNGNGGYDALADIYGNVVSPLPDVQDNTISLPTLHRRIGDASTTPISIRRVLASEVSGVIVTTNVPWLHVRALNNEHFLTLRIWADRLTSEGQFTVPAIMSFTSGGSRRTMDISLSGAIQSDVISDPPSISFGVIRKGSVPPSVSCIIKLPTTYSGSITAISGSSVVSTNVRRVGVNTVLLNAYMKPSSVGELNGEIIIRHGDSPVTAIPVTAYIVN